MLGTVTEAAWPTAEAAHWDAGITSCVCPNKLSIQRQHSVFSSIGFFALAFYLTLYLYLSVTLSLFNTNSSLFSQPLLKPLSGYTF